MGMTDKNKLTENVVSHSPKSNTTMAFQESMSSKRQSRQSAPVGHPFLMNKYKLDNRPTAFRVIPPLPSGFADVSRSLSFSSSGIIVFAPSFMWMEFTKILLLFLFENEKMKEAHFTNNGNYSKGGRHSLRHLIMNGELYVLAHENMSIIFVCCFFF